MLLRNLRSFLSPYWTFMLQLKTYRAKSEKEPCIGLIQENSIKNSVQNCLPYIPKTIGPCSTTLAYPKWLIFTLRLIYVKYAIWYYLSKTFCNVSCSTWLCDCDYDM